MTEAVLLAKNREIKNYFDKVLNEDMKAYLCEAILYAFGGSFSSYWANFVFRAQKDLMVIFGDYAQQHNLTDAEQVCAHVEQNLSPAQRMQFLDISSVAKSIVYFKGDAEKDSRLTKNFEAFCEFFEVESPKNMLDQLHNILQNRNRTAGHPSDQNIAEHCTAQKFARCVKTCKKIIGHIAASGKTTQTLTRLQQQCIEDFEKLQARADCEPYSLYDAKELAGYTLGTVNAFLNDEAFGRQIAHLRDGGSIVFLDVQPAEVKRRLDSYVRATEKQKTTPAPQPTAPMTTLPTMSQGSKKVLKLLPLLLLVPLIVGVILFSSVFGMIRNQLKGQQGGSPLGGALGQPITTTTAALTGPRIHGEANLHDVLFLSVDQRQGETITLIFENRSVYGSTLGWAAKAPCYAVTDKGTFAGAMPKSTLKINAATREQVAVTFPGLTGTIQSITVEQVHLLKSDGLPSVYEGETLTVEIVTEG